MKTWTNPTVEELEVEQTAGGFWHWYFESGWTHGSHGNGNGGSGSGSSGDGEVGGDDLGGEDNFDETTDGMS